MPAETHICYCTKCNGTSVNKTKFYRHNRGGHPIPHSSTFSSGLALLRTAQNIRNSAGTSIPPIPHTLTQAAPHVRVREHLTYEANETRDMDTGEKDVNMFCEPAASVPDVTVFASSVGSARLTEAAASEDDFALLEEFANMELTTSRARTALAAPSSNLNSDIPDVDELQPDPGSLAELDQEEPPQPVDADMGQASQNPLPALNNGEPAEPEPR
ncbi:hypothetical protein BXZ70DRAFT_1072270, partial [Cristinia sonorae]